jgi:hypothetical protein
MRNIINISIASLILILSSCIKQSNEYPLDLSEIADINHGSTTDGDSLYWIIYEDWNNDSQRYLLYIDKETYDSLEFVVEQFQNADLQEKDSLNEVHGFTIIKDSGEPHLSSIR